MSGTYSKSRQQAEVAFGLTQTPFFGHSKAIEELDSMVQTREAKTLRLREARLAKEVTIIATAARARLTKR